MKVKNTNTVILEKLPFISLAGLRSAGFFRKGDTFKSLPIIIKKANGLSITEYNLQVSVSTQDGNTYLAVDYLIDNLPMSYQIPLVQVTNYVTGGFTFYFSCIKTGKKCRKLYLHENCFQHRTGINNVYYLQAILSKNSRLTYKRAKKINTLERAVAERGKKHFKTHYNFILTKNQKKVMQANKELLEMQIN